MGSTGKERKATVMIIKFYFISRDLCCMILSLVQTQKRMQHVKLKPNPVRIAGMTWKRTKLAPDEK